MVALSELTDSEREAARQTYLATSTEEVKESLGLPRDGTETAMDLFIGKGADS